MFYYLKTRKLVDSDNNYIFDINLNFFIFFSIIIISLGFFGILLYKKNLILVLVSLEVILLGVNMIIIPTSFFFDDVAGYLFSLFTFSVAGSEVSVGLALAILLYRVKKKINLPTLNYLKY